MGHVSASNDEDVDRDTSLWLSVSNTAAINGPDHQVPAADRDVVSETVSAPLAGDHGGSTVAAIGPSTAEGPGRTGIVEDRSSVSTDASHSVSGTQGRAIPARFADSIGTVGSSHGGWTTDAVAFAASFDVLGSAPSSAASRSGGASALRAASEPDASPAAVASGQTAAAGTAGAAPSGSEAEIAFISGVTSAGKIAATAYWTWKGNAPAGYNTTSSAHKWGSSTPGTSGTATYWFDPGSKWTTAEKNALTSGMALWSAEANISFSLASSATAAGVVFIRGSDGSASTTNSAANATVGTGTLGGPSTPVTISIDTSVGGFGPIGAGFNVSGGYPYDTLVHEEGHMIGLGHGGAYNEGDGLGSVQSRQFSIYDTRLWTIMSYIEPSDTAAAFFNSYTVTGTSWNGNDPTTPMMLDILAAQRLYGAATSGPLASGGQVFGFNCNIAGTTSDASIHRYFDFTVNKTPVVTLWDGGTNNTLDLSGYSTAATINLTDGTFSSCAGLTNNVAIAAGTEIDTAKGGSAGDAITANQNGDALYGNGGNDNLYGLNGNDSLYGGTGDDTLKGGGGADHLDGGAGTNTASYLLSTDAVIVNLASGTGSGGDADGDTLVNIQTLQGSGSGDILSGDANANTLEGEGGNDTLKGGGGADHLDGGSGNNSASYLTSSSAVVVNLATGTGSSGDAQGDTLVKIQNLTGSDYADILAGDGNVNILQGEGGNDTLKGGGGADKLDGGTGNNTASYLNSAAAVVVSLASGTGTGGEAQGDTLTNIQNLTGSSLGDTLVGDGSVNILSGAGGDDTLKGGGGADTLDGGTGNNTASYVTASSRVVVSLGTGKGTFGDADGDTLTNIQNLTGSNFSDTLSGDSNANVLLGLGGNDTLKGGGGADTLDGGTGNNTASYIGSSAGVIVDLLAGTGSGGDAQGNILINIQNLTGSNLGDTLTGDGKANVLFGEGGDDLLVGGAGADTLDGGGGTNTASYLASVAGVSINLQAGIGSGGDAEGDTLANIQNVTGSNLGDTLTGNGTANILLGQGGDDTLKGGGGADTLDGGSGTNTASYVLASAGVVVSLLTGTGTGGDAAGDTLANIQNLTGSADDDTLTGDANANILLGENGNDTLIGGGGADQLDGGGGNDTASYATSAAGITVNLLAGTASGGDAAGDILTAIQNLIGSNFNDVLTGNDSANTLRGLDGNDRLIAGIGIARMVGGGGNDTFYVDDASDLIFEAVGGGSDKVITSVSYTLQAGQEIEQLGTTSSVGTSAIDLTGNGFDNRITGNAGDNVIDGKAGADVMIGLGGNDTYKVDDAGDKIIEAAGGGSDRVLASVSYTLGAGQEIEALSTASASGTTAIDLTGNQFDNRITGNAGNDVIDGGGGKDVLKGGGGQDAFAFTAALGGGNRDTVTDFSTSAGDLIDLSHVIFSAAGSLGTLAATAFEIGTAANSAGDRIVYNSTSGALYYDADGNGSGKQIEFAKLTSGLAMTNTNFQIV